MADLQEQQEQEQLPITIPHTYKLAYPIQWGSETVAEIVFNRRLQAKDFKGVPAGGELKFDHMMKILARVTGKAETLIEQLDAVDLQNLSNVVNSFLLSGPGTGAT